MYDEEPKEDTVEETDEVVEGEEVATPEVDGEEVAPVEGEDDEVAPVEGEDDEADEE